MASGYGGPGLLPAGAVSGRRWEDNTLSGDDAFASARVRQSEADYQELVQASLEQLRRPSHTVAFLPAFEGEGQHLVLDLEKLTQSKRSLIVEKALQTTDQDNGKLYTKIRQRIDRAGITLPTVEVRFQDLSVTADVSVGSRSLPTLPNSYLSCCEACLQYVGLGREHKRRFTILDGVSGVLRPGTMTLLLGPPGSGKSTLLKVLAGVHHYGGLEVRGDVTYNGHGMTEFVPEKTSAYVDQVDNHIPEMTVRETFAFAAHCQGFGYKAGVMGELRQREKELGIVADPEIDAFMKATVLRGHHDINTEMVLKILGLDICADTSVGDNMVRGVSGGQRKRVTTGEMLVAAKKTLFLDEISTGLDSSTTFQIITCLRNVVRFTDATILCALLQPAPETFGLFDAVMLLSEGSIVYHGPREGVLPFFEGLGLQLPPRKGLADFLQEVTSRKDQAQYWSREHAGRPYLPVTAIAAAFRESKQGIGERQALAQPFDRGRMHPLALCKRRYALSSWAMLRVCLHREALLMWRNAFLYGFRTAQVAFLALLTGFLFFRTRLHANSLYYGFLYFGALFYSIIHMMVNGLSELTLTVQRMGVFFKQRSNAFYPGWVYTIPTFILRLPFSAVEGIVWSICVYWLVGLDPEPGRFFILTLILTLMHQLSISLFRVCGTFGRNVVLANTVGTFFLLVIFLTGGFVLSKGDIPPWWIWSFWISPLSYVQRAVAINEFDSARWGGSEGLGRQVLTAFSEPTGFWWVWLGVGVLVAFIISMNVLVAVATSYLPPLTGGAGNMPEEMLAEIEANRKGATPPGSRKSFVPLDASGTLDSMQGIPAKHNSQRHIQQATNEHAPSFKAGAQQGTGMETLSFQPLSLTFQDMCYWVTLPKGRELQLLKEVTGAFRPGVLTALVGVSGAGKTTLMDVLAGRKTGGRISGEIMVDGHPKVQETFARVSGYVEQADIHSPATTVHEALLFSAHLRLACDVDRRIREAFVQEVEELVELTYLRGGLVGLPGRDGLSVEQRKRLTLAVELVANPSIIFMDEPTSGLDARAAAIVMRVIKSTVLTGRCVVSTIHQPSQDIFEAFDELLLLKRGGYCIYCGPLGGESVHLVDYFEAIPGVPGLKSGINPATWVLEVSTPGSEEQFGADFADVYRNSGLFKQVQAVVDENNRPKPGSQPLQFRTQYSRNAWTQFVLILGKNFITYWRTPQYKAVSYVVTALMGVLIGSFYWQLGLQRANQQSVLNIAGALYSAVLFLGVQNASTVQNVVGVERSVYYREHAAGMYAAIPFGLAQSMVEEPFLLVQTAIYGVITYFMIHFEYSAAKFFWYLLFMYLTLSYWTFFGMMAVALCPSVQLASVLSSFFYSFWNIMAGYIIPQPAMPPWLTWYSYLNPVFYSLYGLIGSQLGDVDDQQMVNNFSGETVSVSNFILTWFGYHHSFIGWCVLILFAFVAAFRCVIAFALKYINWQKR